MSENTKKGECLQLFLANIVSKHLVAVSSLNFKSFSRPDVHIHRKGPKPSENMSPMTSCMYEGYLNLVVFDDDDDDDDDEFSDEDEERDTSSRKALP